MYALAMPFIAAKQSGLKRAGEFNVHAKTNMVIFVFYSPLLKSIHNKQKTLLRETRNVIWLHQTSTIPTIGTSVITLA